MTKHSLIPACAHVRQLQKWDGLFLPSCHSPDLARSNYHLFGPVKDALHGCHFVDENKLKQSFCDVLYSKGKEFYNIGYCVLLNFGKSMIKIMISLWKNCLITA
jgi:hypothetical protein